MAGQNSQVNIGAGKSTKRRWELHEDNVLVSCMVDLYNMGAYNADTGFKAGYLNELERMMSEKLPNSELSMIYAKDRATGADAQSIDDIIEEVAAQEREEVDMRDDCFGMDPLDDGRREPNISMSSTGNSSANSSRQKRKRSNKGDDKMQEAITNALMMVGNELKGLGQNLKGIAIETQMQESSAKLEAVIAEVDGLIDSEKMLAHYKLCNNPSLMFAFLALFLKDAKAPIKGGLGIERTLKRILHRTISLDDIRLVKNEMNMAAAALIYTVFSNVTLSISSVVGPAEEISFYGHPIAYLAPTVYGHPQALTVHFQSHADKMTIVLAVDQGVIPDPHRLCDDLEESLQLMKNAVVDRRSSQG
ncbi:hypothetical protein Ancab_009088 [Ancistrocladus abbreviatus]